MKPEKAKVILDAFSTHAVKASITERTASGQEFEHNGFRRIPRSDMAGMIITISMHSDSSVLERTTGAVKNPASELSKIINILDEVGYLETTRDENAEIDMLAPNLIPFEQQGSVTSGSVITTRGQKVTHMVFIDQNPLR